MRLVPNIVKKTVPVTTHEGLGFSILLRNSVTRPTVEPRSRSTARVPASKGGSAPGGSPDLIL